MFLSPPPAVEVDVHLPCPQLLFPIFQVEMEVVYQLERALRTTDNEATGPQGVLVCHLVSAREVPHQGFP